jgi:hypothetical protein
MGEGLLIENFQSLQRSISIGIGLKICQKPLSIAIAYLMKLDTLVDLSKNRDIWSAVTGVESTVVTISTTTCRDRTIPVRASKPTINHHLLKALTIDLFKIPYV